ncbi:MAG TPA: hypothetical protein VK907_11920, partial [Phnomibacter sp.]|nr:hypothetical protein [Phnomibacter sp.]
FNSTLSNGKWNHMMSLKPRDLPVFHEPQAIGKVPDDNEAWGVAPEGFPKGRITLETGAAIVTSGI